MSRKEDEAIRELFKGEAERMAAPDSLKTRIDREIDRIENERIEKRKGSEKEAVIMKFQKRKVALAAAVIVAAAGSTLIYHNLPQTKVEKQLTLAAKYMTELNYLEAQAACALIVGWRMIMQRRDSWMRRQKFCIRDTRRHSPKFCCRTTVRPY